MAIVQPKRNIFILFGVLFTLSVVSLFLIWSELNRLDVDYQLFGLNPLGIPDLGNLAIIQWFLWLLAQLYKLL